MTWGPFLQDSFSTDVAKSTGQPEMYCETNSSTHLLVKFELNVINPTASTPTPAVLPDAIVIKKLALLLVAFEGEIDKLLADHAGYITHSVRAASTFSPSDRELLPFSTTNPTPLIRLLPFPQATTPSFTPSQWTKN